MCNIIVTFHPPVSPFDDLSVHRVTDLPIYFPYFPFVPLESEAVEATYLLSTRLEGVHVISLRGLRQIGQEAFTRR